MSGNATEWVADKLANISGLEISGRTPEGFLAVNTKEGYTFLVAVLGARGVINLPDVEPLFIGATTPQFVVNVPSNTLWSGTAIDRIHSASAAFGTLGDVSRAAEAGDAGSYRDRNMSFFINAMKQHGNVTNLSYVYESVFRVDRRIGESITVAVIDAYNMSAEDIRSARARFGHFDVVVKSTSYGSITTQATEAAASMGVQALKFRELMMRLAR